MLNMSTDLPCDVLPDVSANARVSIRGVVETEAINAQGHPVVHDAEEVLANTVELPGVGGVVFVKVQTL